MKRVILGIILVLVLVFFFLSAFVVDVTKQAIVLEFGKPVRVIKDPGLYFKEPFFKK